MRRRGLGQKYSEVMHQCVSYMGLPSERHCNASPRIHYELHVSNTKRKPQEAQLGGKSIHHNPYRREYKVTGPDKRTTASEPVQVCTEPAGSTSEPVQACTEHAGSASEPVWQGVRRIRANWEVVSKS